MTDKIKKCVMIIAGEASGDLHGANLVKAMLEKDDSLFICGIGGPKMAEAGVKILYDAAKLSVIGIFEVLAKLPSVFRGRAIAKGIIKNLSPDLVILVDFAEFNMHIAGIAKKHGIPVMYYISPQIWAWRSGRVKKIKRRIDHMAVILPFEAKFYEDHNVPVTFVGHPLMDDANPFKNEPVEKIANPSPVIGFLPGSRHSEIKRHLPLMLKAANALKTKAPDFKFLISMPPSADKNYVENIVSREKIKTDFEYVYGGANQVFIKSDLVVVASGTVTLEAAISCTQMVIIYKLSPLTYWLGKKLIKVDHIGLANLIAGKKLVPELIQSDANPENIANVVLSMIRDQKGRAILEDQLCQVKQKLGGPGASGQTADIALKMISR